MFHGILTFICPKYAVLCRRYGARRRSSSVVFSDILRLTCTKYDVFCGVVTIDVTTLGVRLSSVVRCPGLLLTSVGVHSQRLEVYRRDVRQWFFYVVSNVIPKLIFSKYGIFRRRCAQCLFSSSVPYVIPRFICAVWRLCNVLKIGVAALCVNFPASCLMPPLNVPWKDLEFFLSHPLPLIVT